MGKTTVEGAPSVRDADLVGCTQHSYTISKAGVPKIKGGVFFDQENGCPALRLLFPFCFQNVFFEGMRFANLQPDSISYSVSIKTCETTKRWHEALTLYRAMLEAKIEWR